MSSEINDVSVLLADVKNLAFSLSAHRHQVSLRTPSSAEGHAVECGEVNFGSLVLDIPDSAGVIDRGSGDHVRSNVMPYSLDGLLLVTNKFSCAGYHVFLETSLLNSPEFAGSISRGRGQELGSKRRELTIGDSSLVTLYQVEIILKLLEFVGGEHCDSGSSLPREGSQETIGYDTLLILSDGWVHTLELLSLKGILTSDVFELFDVHCLLDHMIFI
jgi:hypothetical protein